MRVLLTNHGPLAGDEAGRVTHDLAAALQAAGHEVHCLIYDHHPAATSAFPVRSIVCRPNDAQAELPFDLPVFKPQRSGDPTFQTLSDEEIDAYRDEARRQLDDEVDRFNPQVIHTQHIWLHAQLALETGVPYVITAWGPELDAAAADERYRGLAEQAAENAGRILAGTSALAERIVARFDGVAERTVVIPQQTNLAAWLADLYQAVLSERFGEQMDTIG